jgi:hypothetical protein
MLRELAEIGMAVARAIGRRAERVAADLASAGEGAGDGPVVAADDLGLAFARISRAVRLTLALEARMEGEAAEKAREAARTAEIWETAKDAGERARVGRKLDALEAVVQDLIEEEAGENEMAAERLHEALDERLDEIVVDELMDRPMVELVAMICRDLGVSPDWRAFEDDDWVVEAGGLEAVVTAWAKAGDGSAEAPEDGDVTEASSRRADPPPW